MNSKAAQTFIITILCALLLPELVSAQKLKWCVLANHDL